MALDNHPFKTKAELNAFLRLHETLNDRMAATVWIFESGDFFILCDSDITFSDESVPAANVVKYCYTRDDDTIIKLVRVHAKNHRQLLKHILLVRHFRLDLFKSGSTGLSYERTASASPCDLGDVKDLMFTEEDAEYAEALRMGPICAIVLEGETKEPRIGMALWHSATKSVKLAEFYDNTSMDLLESMVIQCTPVECLLSSQAKYRTVRAVLGRNKILMSNDVPSKSEMDKVVTDISRMSDLTINKDADSQGLAKRALAILNVHLKISLEVMCKNGTPFVDTQEFVRFNAQADEGLNIFDSADHGFSLFKVLNKTRTAGGERLLKVWLRQPLTEPQKIKERLDMVEQLIDNSSSRKTLHESSLRKMPDLESLSIKLSDKRVQLIDLYKIYMAIKEVERMAEIFKQMKGANDLLNEHFGVPFVKKLAKMDRYQDLIKTTLDFEAVSSDNVFVVRAAFDDKLLKIKSEMDQVKKSIESSVSKMAASINLDKKCVKLDWSTMHGYCFRVTMKDEINLRSKKGISIVDSSKSGVRFRNKDLEVLNKEYRALNEAYEEQQQYVVKEILEIAVGYVPFISELGHLCSKLDCLVSFAVASVSAPIPYTKPEIVDRSTGILQLDEARHPCLELMDSINFIPNGVDFEADKKTFCIVTGPNLGGKSTYLRSIALNVLMAQVGCFVASTKAVLFPVDRVLVRIGAGDSQLTGVSTFMAEMLEAASIVRSSTRHSLILIDELGRGTSTYDGLGLAWAISHHIAAEIKAFSLFATHFHEITRLSEELPNVFNCHVDAVTSENEFTLLYNVRPGSSNKSFGLEVARLAGFPKEVMDDAKQFLAQAEMPLLRGGKQGSNAGLDSKEVKAFLVEWKNPQTNEKRKCEMVEAMKTKVAKIEENLA